VKKIVYLTVALLLAGILIRCQDNTAEFSPGASDPRIIGTWRLVERLYQSDSAYYRIDSVFVKGGYKIDSAIVNGVYIKDSVFVKDRYVKDSIRITKTIDVTRKYSVAYPQTITFAPDGKLSANGSEMTYYAPIKYFRVDSTSRDSLGVNLYITTNRATVPFRQGVAFRADTLLLLPRCERACYSRFLRVR
jgi:hypothetical protein